MKRLTKRLEDEQAVMDCTGCPESWNTNPVGKCTALYCRNMLKDRLAAIEDILGDEYDLDRLRELAQADREGRCVVLPCKKGDVVWRIVHDATPHITKDRCTDITLVGGDVWARLIGDMKMGAWNFGRLLFTTRADAEAALRREQDGNNK